MNTTQIFSSSFSNILPKSVDLDKKKIIESIKEKGEYSDQGILIKPWEKDSNVINHSYIADLNKDDSHFIGVLNSRLERSTTGIQYFKGGEKYLGNFDQDLPNKHGIFIWSPVKKGSEIYTEMYHGFWNKNTKEKSGIYIWINEPSSNKEFDAANFDAYCGLFEKDKFKRGTYLSKINEDYYLYHGNFDSQGKKNDDNAFFYCSNKDRIIHGKIVDDKFLNAHVSYFDDDGNVQKLVYATFDNNRDVKNVILEEKLKPEECENEKKVVTQFRNVILGIDYFGAIYEKYHEILNFIKENVNSIEILQDEEIFPRMIKLINSYGKDNIYFDIESNVKNILVN